MPRRLIITIGDRVRKLRDNAGMTQFDLAAKAGVKPGTIHRLESNKGNSSLVSLHKIAVALGVTIDSLVNGQKPQKRNT